MNGLRFCVDGDGLFSRAMALHERDSMGSAMGVFLHSLNDEQKVMLMGITYATKRQLEERVEEMSQLLSGVEYSELLIKGDRDCPDWPVAHCEISWCVQAIKEKQAKLSEEAEKVKTLFQAFRIFGLPDPIFL